MKRILRFASWIALVVLALFAAYAVNVWLGMRAAARISGTLSGLGVIAPVTILRDDRGVPHISARNEHDLFFAEGFAEGSDRLFQMDLTRRAVEGRLAEVFGRAALPSDEQARYVPVESIVERQWMRLSPQLRRNLQAFAAGVNAAMRTQPLPVEFRVLLYKPQAWRPQDSLVTSFAIVLELTDTWSDIAHREPPNAQDYDVLHPLTDPCYDAPVLAGLSRISQTPDCLPQLSRFRSRPVAGSNAWASGAAHTDSGRALLANDPHLPPSIPGIWYLVDLRYPGYHVAGATIAGIPGVLLGHDDRIAWGATNGSTASLSALDAPSRLDDRDWVDETFNVRFSSSVRVRYYRDGREFGAYIDAGEKHAKRLVLVRWDAYAEPDSPFATFDSLDRARSIADALHALRFYPGPTQNFVLADTSGSVAYQLAGDIPNDPAWARYIHSSTDLAKSYAVVPFERLPRVTASREAIVWTANNKMYAGGYPYRLSPEFSPPYRAYRIAQLLKARTRYGVAYFSKMQMDTLSLPERDIIRLVGAYWWGGRNNALSSWNGEFVPSSRIATEAYNIRVKQTMGAQGMMRYMLGLRTMRSTIARGAPASGLEALKKALRSGMKTPPWSVAGAMTPSNPLSHLGLNFLNGTTFAGDGDAFTVHVQTRGLSQSFRAVWDVGNWDAGGITLPQGESGEPGSGHYTDQAEAWVGGKLLSLPYSVAAVKASARQRLTLMP